jgi:hypothetical protein
VNHANQHLRHFIGCSHVQRTNGMNHGNTSSWQGSKLVYLRPQLKDRARKPLTLTNCHEQEVQGTCHAREESNFNLGTYFIILGVLQT